jgi:hypothetical protein
MRKRGLILVLCLLVSSSFSNSQQYTKEQIEDIIFDFREGVGFKIKEERMEQLIKMSETEQNFLNSEEVVPVLIGCLKDRLPEPLETRVKEAIQKEGISMVFKPQDQSSVPIQGWAVRTLIKIGKPAVLKLISSINTQPETISTVTGILGEIGDKRAVSSIISLLDNTSNDFSVRYAAASLLGKLGSPEAIPQLIEALKGQPNDTYTYNSNKLSNTAADSLAKLTGQSFGFTLTFSRVTKGGDKSPNFQINGSKSEKEKTIKKWNEWWHEYESMFIDVSKFMDIYAISLTKGDKQAIQYSRSTDYIQIIDGRIIDQTISTNEENILSNCTKDLINSLEYRKKVEYQIKCKSLKIESDNIIVSCEDKLLLDSGEYKRIFSSQTKRILVKNKDSYQIRQEDLSMWTNITYESEN